MKSYREATSLTICGYLSAILRRVFTAAFLSFICLTDRSKSLQKSLISGSAVKRPDLFLSINLLLARPSQTVSMLKEEVLTSFGRFFMKLLSLSARSAINKSYEACMSTNNWALMLKVFQPKSKVSGNSHFSANDSRNC